MDFKTDIPLDIPDPSGEYTVILADGDYPSTRYALTLLEGASRVVCCDWAADSYIGHGNVPYAIVGDMDSVSGEVKSKYALLLHHNGDQETNDLTKAVLFCKSHMDPRGDILILGATGRREDHTIGNISLLADYNTGSPPGVRVRMVTDRGVIDHIDTETAFSSFPGQQVTILCLDPDTRITTHRLKYPLRRANLRAWWQGTLNESQGDVFGIITDGDTFVYRLF